MVILKDKYRTLLWISHTRSVYSESQSVCSLNIQNPEHFAENSWSCFFSKIYLLSELKNVFLGNTAI